MALATFLAYLGYRHFWHRDPLDARLSTLVTVRAGATVDCATFKKHRPLVLLALGQSNAGNHGSPSSSVDAPVAMVAGTDCVLASDPLPGATGSGGSIWRHLPALLEQQMGTRGVVLAVLAVDATAIDDWTRSNSPLANRLVAQVKALDQRGMQPDLVLWQQGEADARNHTSASEYLARLHALAAVLERAGSRAPVLLARSTVCRSPANAEIRSAIERAIQENGRFMAGPDTDSLLGEAYRSDGCHLNPQGLRVAARAWADVIRARVAGTTP